MSIRRGSLGLAAGLVCVALSLVGSTGAWASSAVAAGPEGPQGSAPNGYVIVEGAAVSAPSGDLTTSTLTCPGSKVPLSGGGFIASKSVETGINESYPVTLHKWLVTVSNFSAAATTFDVWMVCVKKPAGYAQEVGDALAGPAGQQTTAQEECPSGDVITGGGVIMGTGGVDSTSDDLSRSWPAAFTLWAVNVTNFSTTATLFNVVAVCADLPTQTDSYQLIPSVPADNPPGHQNAQHQFCPSGTSVLGGGGGSFTSRLRVTIKTTIPGGTAGDGYWKVGENNDTTADDTVTAYAICAS